MLAVAPGVPSLSRPTCRTSLNLHGSTIESIRGAESFASYDVHIAQDQLVPLGVAVLADMGVRIDNRPDGP